MKALQLFLYLVLFQLLAASGFAQEHFTEGNVRAVSFYRTSPGQFDNYMTYLRTHFLPQQEEAKKQGLVLDYYILLNQPSNLDDWDVAVGNVFKSFGDALDYNQETEDKINQIAEKHFKTQDEEKMRNATDKRFEMRKFIGTRYYREINLKPITK